MQDVGSNKPPKRIQNLMELASWLWVTHLIVQDEARNPGEPMPLSPLVAISTLPDIWMSHASLILQFDWEAALSNKNKYISSEKGNIWLLFGWRCYALPWPCLSSHNHSCLQERRFTEPREHEGGIPCRSRGHLVYIYIFYTGFYKVSTRITRTKTPSTSWFAAHGLDCTNQ